MTAIWPIVKILQVDAWVCHLARFGKTAGGKVVGEQSGNRGALARGERLAGRRFVSACAQVLSERIGIRFVHAVPPRQMRGQFAAEQMGVAARQHDDVSLPLEAVCEQFPPLDVLNLVEQDEPHVGCDLDQDFQHVVEVARGKAEQPLIVEVDIAVGLPAQDAVSQDGFPAAPDAGDDLDQVIGQSLRERLLAIASHATPLQQDLALFPLVQHHLSYGSFVSHNAPNVLFNAVQCNNKGCASSSCVIEAPHPAPDPFTR